MGVGFEGRRGQAWGGGWREEGPDMGWGLGGKRGRTGGWGLKAVGTQYKGHLEGLVCCMMDLYLLLLQESTFSMR